jgi:hypothetical protein
VNTREAHQRNARGEKAKTAKKAAKIEDELDAPTPTATASHRLKIASKTPDEEKSAEKPRFSLPCSVLLP